MFNFWIFRGLYFQVTYPIRASYIYDFVRSSCQAQVSCIVKVLILVILVYWYIYKGKINSREFDNWAWQECDCRRVSRSLLVFTLVFLFWPQWSIARITEPDINILEKHGGREQKLDPELNIRIKVRQVMCGHLANNMFV